jgi:tape measure domain-containing protein
MATNLEAKIEINAETSKARSEIGKFEQAFSKTMAELGKSRSETSAIRKLADDAAKGRVNVDQLDQEARELVQTYQRLKQEAGDRDLLGVSKMRNAQQEIQRLESALNRLRTSGTASHAELARATEYTKTRTAQLRGEMEGVEPASKGASRGLQNMALAAKAFVAAAIANAAREAVVGMESLGRTMKTVFGSTEAANTEFKFTAQLAQRLGVDVQALSGSYAKLAASTRGTALEGQKTRDIFTAFSVAMAKTGASSEDVSLAMTQLAQGMSKGKFELDDVKSIMERIPGSAKLFADGLGKGTQELYDMISAGELGREEMVKIGAELRRVYDDGAKVEGLAPAWERFTNTISVSASKMYEASGAGNALGGALDIITKGAGFVAVGFGTVAAKVEQAGSVLASVGSFIKGDTSWFEMRRQIEEAGTAASTKIAKLADDVFSLNDENAKVPAAAGSAGAAMAAEGQAAETAASQLQQAVTAIRERNAAAAESIEQDKAKAASIDELIAKTDAEIAAHRSTISEMEARRDGTQGLTVEEMNLLHQLGNTTAGLEQQRAKLEESKAATLGEAEAKRQSIPITEEFADAVEILGLNMEEMGGIMTAEGQQIVAAFTEIASSARTSGDQVLQAYASAMQKAGTDTAALRAIAAELKMALDNGKITADQYAHAMARISVESQQAQNAAKGLIAAQIQEQQSIMALAKAKGEEWKAADAALKIKRLEAQQAVISAEASRTAAQASLQAAQAKQAEAQANSESTAAQREAAASAVQEADAKYKAAEAAVQLAAHNKAAADATYSLADASRDATNAVDKMAGSQSKTAQAGEDAAHSTKEAGRAAADAEPKVKSVTVSFEQLAQQMGLAAENADLFGQIVSNRIDQINSGKILSVTTYMTSLNNAYRDAAREARRLSDAQDQLNAKMASAQDGARDLELRLLELTGTEEQIADARAKREREQIELMAEKASLARQVASATGDTAALAAANAEIASYTKQLRLLDAIHAAEKRNAKAEQAAQQPSAAQSTPTGSFSNQTVKTVKIDFGQGQSVDVLPGQEAVVERVIKDLATGRARA